MIWVYAEQKSLQCNSHSCKNIHEIQVMLQ